MISVLAEVPPGSKERLHKPKCLYGIKPSFSVRWGNGPGGRPGPKCEVYADENDIYVKHKDWCSKTFYGEKMAYVQRYVYSDGFTSLTIKGQSWIKLVGILNYTPAQALRVIAEECLIDEHSRFCMDDKRMFDDIVQECARRGWMKDPWY